MKIILTNKAQEYDKNFEIIEQYKKFSHQEFSAENPLINSLVDNAFNETVLTNPFLFIKPLLCSTRFSHNRFIMK